MQTQEHNETIQKTQNSHIVLYINQQITMAVLGKSTETTDRPRVADSDFVGHQEFVQVLIL